METTKKQQEEHVERVLYFDGEDPTVGHEALASWTEKDRQRLREILTPEYCQTSFTDCLDSDEVEALERDIANDIAMIDCFSWISLAVH